MGGFLLVDNNAPGVGEIDDVHTRNALAAFEDKGLKLNTTIDNDSCTIFVFGKIHVSTENALCLENGDFVVATGTLIYKRLFGTPALRALYEDFSDAGVPFDDLKGQFGVLLQKNGKRYVFTDYNGVYHLFSNSRKTVISSSFLAVSKGMQPTTICANAVYEYLTISATYGNDTIFNEIRMLESSEIHVLSPESTTFKKQISVEELPENISFENAVNETVGHLSDYFSCLKSIFDNNICQALSGGYDSRLMLCLARKTNIAPHLYVYGGNDNSDVRVAKKIAAGENFTISHSNREASPRVTPEEFQRLATESFHLLDGRGIFGVFDANEEIATRHQRSQTALLQLNGVGGEIYRNYWYVLNRSVRARRFADIKLNAGHYPCFTDAFNHKSFTSNMASKVKYMAGTESDVISRKELEILYPSMRLRYWMGQNISANNFFSFAITPYAEAQFTIPSSSIPIPYKDFGRFQSALIEKADPALAGYLSAYGHKFCGPLPARVRLLRFAKMSIPIIARPYIRKFRTRNPNIPYFLTKPYIETMLDPAFNDISEYVNMETVHDRGLYNRALTLQLVIDYATSNNSKLG